MFMVIRKSIKEIRRRAHLCPPTLTGSRSCLIKVLENQFWKVSRRLFKRRLQGVGYKIQGRAMASIIKGTPNSSGLINWSKRLVIMISFSCLL